MTQILLSRSGTVLVAIASIARLEVAIVLTIIPIPSMVMSSMIMSSMGVMGVSSRVWGIAGLLLSSGVVLPLAILPLAAVNLLLLAFKDDGLVYQLLVVVEGSHHQLHSQLIIQSFEKLLLLCGISGHIIWGITS
jgi:hypothetical protein